jgi:hypothetical protein
MNRAMEQLTQAQHRAAEALYKNAGAAPGSGGSEGSAGSAISRGSRVFVVVNTDPHWMQHGWVQVPIWELGIGDRDRYVVEDLLDGARDTWRGEWNYVKLDPAERVAHVLVVADTASRTRDAL